MPCLTKLISALAISSLLVLIGFADTTNNLIVAHFQPAKTNYYLGEPITVYLTVLSKYTNTVFISDNMHAAFKNRSEMGESSNVLDVDRFSYMNISAIIPLWPNDNIQKTYYINKSLKLEKSGRYYVDCKAEIFGARVIKVHDQISFTLTKGSDEQLCKVYGELLEKTKTRDNKHNTEAVDAAYALSSVRNPIVVPYLIGAMAVPDPMVPQSVIKALEEIGTPEAVKGIIGIDSMKKNMFLKEYGASALGRMKAKEGIPFLIKLLDDNYDQAQISAIQALGQIGAAECLDAIRKKMDSFKGKVKDTAVEVLKKKQETERIMASTRVFLMRNIIIAAMLLLLVALLLRQGKGASPANRQ